MRRPFHRCSDALQRVSPDGRVPPDAAQWSYRGILLRVRPSFVSCLAWLKGPLQSCGFRFNPQGVAEFFDECSVDGVTTTTEQPTSACQLRGLMNNDGRVHHSGTQLQQPGPGCLWRGRNPEQASHDRAHTDHREATNLKIAAHDGAGTNCGTFADSRLQSMFIRVGRPQLLQIRIVALGNRSFVKMTPALIITPSSSVTPLQM